MAIILGIRQTVTFTFEKIPSSSRTPIDIDKVSDFAHELEYSGIMTIYSAYLSCVASNISSWAKFSGTMTPLSVTESKCFALQSRY